MMRNKLLIYAGILVALLPVLLFRDYTPSNELRYLSIVDEALLNGNIFTFTNQGALYADKPPMYFWLMMLGKLLLGKHYMWFLSLLSLVPALLIAGLMDKWIAGERNITPLDRLTGQLMLMTSGLFLGLGVVLRMDMLMCLFILLSLHTFYRMVQGTGNLKRQQFLFPLYIFLALFTKGPVGVLVPLLSTLVFLLVTGRMRQVGRYWGWKTWLVLLGGCALWFGGVYWEGGYAYLDNLLFHQTVDRAVDSFHHKEPFYYYLISVWYSMAPYSLLLVGMIVAGACRRLIHSDLERLFMVTLLTTLVMLSCISSKLAVYLAPAFPFFVYLPVVLAGRFRWNHALALALAVPSLVFVAAGPGLAVAAGRPELSYLGRPLFYVSGGVLTLAGLAALYYLYKRRVWQYAANSMAAGLFIAVFIGGWGLPSANEYIGYGKLCAKAREIAASRPVGKYYTLFISRPENMDAYLHTDVHELKPEEMSGGLPQGSLLMVKEDKARTLPEISSLWAGKEQYKVGPYTIVVW